ncbi:glycosyl hydrolase family 95 catalytic domain-containing protein [Kitasatospora purpeofusca]|uniref:glycosyl hydrolase family 95 catalytic domain-containing protein n=1 Tax=Kitasatospora purpeofusca TaxID=67352 RepID=UPI002A5A412E|nr:glycoside hydrolase N-terminal domain-containing protein [Kitasatospora purpeofusca]MDY0812648.1 glycoside hydrolase N-terminal domain-containing protein [Kitasatospora purpeofusca]
MSETAFPHPGPAPVNGVSRRGILRAAASVGALFALGSLPEFTASAVSVPRPGSLSAVPAGQAVTLWYTAPGSESAILEQGLPIGNGRLGAMVTGGPSRDALYLSDATLWTGHANATLGSDGQFPYGAEDFGTFGLLAKAYLDIPAHTARAVNGYRRTLDLSNGVVTASYRFGGVTYRREVYASHPDDVIVVRLTQSGGGTYTGSVTLTGTRGETVSADDATASVSFGAALANTLRYAAVVKAVGTGGPVSASGAKVSFTGCTEVLLIISGGTNYKADPSVAYKDTAVAPLTVAHAKASDAAAVPGTALLATHVADYRRLQQAMTVDLGTSSAVQRAMDTASRLTARAGSGSAPDPELEASYLQFGRYLMICGSRASLPLSLQGLWLDRNAPDWMSDYHTDINVQMNYWLPDRTGLPECFDAFTDYCVAQLPGWQATTRDLFQDPRNRFRNTSGTVAGWTLAISTNVWGGNGWWWHPAGNAWMCNSLYEHYQYTQDSVHLDRIYPLLKGACEFWESRLLTRTVADPATGGTRQVLVDDHDWSPEHGPEDAIGITYAQELVWQLFRNYREAATRLGRDTAYATTIGGLQDRLYLPEVSATSGWLEEWMSDDNLGETTHRHLSPLAGLFPGDRVNLQDSPPATIAGATALLTARGMVSFGWASAWRALCWARLKNADKAYQLVLAVMKPSVNFGNGTGLNMFDMYSFGNRSTFQIDANFGTPSAMVEMLVQSRPGRVELLPGLPSAWAASGSVTGVGVRGGLTADLSWAAGQVTSATLRGKPGTSTTVVFGAWSKAVTVPAGGSVTVSPPPQPRSAVFQLVNRRSGKAIDVPGASTAAGTALIQYTPGSAANQRFRFTPVGGDVHEVDCTHTALTWDISGGSTADGARLTQWTPTHGTNQQWRLTDTGDGYVTITSVRSGKVLGVTGGSTADLAAVEQQTADGGTGQQWRRVPA